MKGAAEQFVFPKHLALCNGDAYVDQWMSLWWQSVWWVTRGRVGSVGHAGTMRARRYPVWGRAAAYHNLSSVLCFLVKF